MSKPLQSYIFLACLLLTLILTACDSGTASPTPAGTPTTGAIFVLPTATTTSAAQPATAIPATAIVATPAPEMTVGTSVPVTGTVGATPTPNDKALIDFAHKIITELAAGEFGDVESVMNTTMRTQLPTESLKTVWGQVTTQFGELKSQNSVHAGVQPGYFIADVNCTFEKGDLVISVVFDNDALIAGLHISPPDNATAQPTTVSSYTPPDYADQSAFTERDISFGDPNWVLTGTLSMPAGTGPFPVVVLVHGSGPEDRDETIGDNKPFKDIAWGLASKGIAVFRYDKRTFVYPQQMASVIDKLTIDDEVVNDAVSALAMLKTQEGIDPKRIFLLGHSLGGMMAPDIAQKSPDEAGFIVMSGPSRPFEDVLMDQFTYLAKLDGTITTDEQAALDKLAAQITTVKALTASSTVTPDQLPLGLPATYWLSLQNYSPATLASTLSEPILVLQGERDYQVTLPDFNGWREALSGHVNAVLKSYPGLSHVYVLGEGTPGPDDYLKAGHVADEVIADLIQWVKGH